MPETEVGVWKGRCRKPRLEWERSDAGKRGWNVQRAMPSNRRWSKGREMPETEVGVWEEGCQRPRLECVEGEMPETEVGVCGTRDAGNREWVGRGMPEIEVGVSGTRDV